VNNTILGHSEQGIYARWSGAKDMVLANNAIYSLGGVAVRGSGMKGPTITIKANFVEGEGATIDNAAFYDGGSPMSAFVNLSGMEYWPASGSFLRDQAHPDFAPKRDFNGIRRIAPFDVGAYEVEDSSTNPGWRVGPGFKIAPIPPAPP
jgi:hypothetical protein